MLPIHTILHPTDFSERSRAALSLACALSRDYGAHLVLLHVVSLPTVVYTEGVLPPAPEQNDEGLQDELDQLQLPDPNLHAERRLLEGDPVTEILRVAQDTNSDLIVMGTHGRTGLARLLMGSVAEQVVRRAMCPVLTVKTPFHGAIPANSTAIQEPALV